MKLGLITFAFLFASSTAFGGQTAISCLGKRDAKTCLVDVASVALGTEKDSTIRLEGASALLTTLAKIDMRRDDILAISRDDESASIYARWTLAVSRNTYAFRFGLPSSANDNPKRIQVLADHLRSRKDAMDRLSVIIASCEAIYREPSQAVLRWNGVLDGSCSISESDADTMDHEFPGLSFIAEPLIAAFHSDPDRLSYSLARSSAILNSYKNALSRKMTPSTRESIHGMLFFGHVLNGWALATSNQAAPSVKAAEIAVTHLQKAPSIEKSKDFQLIRSIISWIYAKAGLRDEALEKIKAMLAIIDKKGALSGGDIALTIAIAIEALHELEIQR